MFEGLPHEEIGPISTRSKYCTARMVSFLTSWWSPKSRRKEEQRRLKGPALGCRHLPVRRIRSDLQSGRQGPRSGYGRSQANQSSCRVPTFLCLLRAKPGQVRNCCCSRCTSLGSCYPIGNWKRVLHPPTTCSRSLFLKPAINCAQTCLIYLDQHINQIHIPFPLSNALRVPTDFARYHHGDASWVASTSRLRGLVRRRAILRPSNRPVRS